MVLNSYKTEGIIESDPETVFHYIDPTIADGPRKSWDKSIKDRQVLEHIQPVIKHVSQ
jgi:hypothetical protein